MWAEEEGEAVGEKAKEVSELHHTYNINIDHSPAKLL